MEADKVTELVSKYFEVREMVETTDPELGFTVYRVHVTGDYADKTACLLALAEAFPGETFSLWIRDPAAAAVIAVLKDHLDELSDSGFVPNGPDASVPTYMLHDARLNDAAWHELTEAVKTAKPLIDPVPPSTSVKYVF